MCLNVDGDISTIFQDLLTRLSSEMYESMTCTSSVRLIDSSYASVVFEKW